MQMYMRMKVNKLDSIFSKLKPLREKYQSTLEEEIKRYCCYTMLAKFDYLAYSNSIIRSNDNKNNLYEYMMELLEHQFAICPLFLEVIKIDKDLTYGKAHSIVHSVKDSMYKENIFMDESVILDKSELINRVTFEFVESINPRNLDLSTFKVDLFERKEKSLAYISRMTEQSNVDYNIMTEIGVENLKNFKIKDN